MGAFVKISLLFAVTLLVCDEVVGAKKGKMPKVAWKKLARFDLVPGVSDEFRGKRLNLKKWDEHGVRNPNTDCPRWNGPPDNGNPPFSTFFPASQDPNRKRRKVRLYKMRRGALWLKIHELPLSFFTDREYYCNATTFTCNHNDKIPCFQTDPFGAPRYVEAPDGTRRFRGVTHDKCKIAPFCVPHFDIVSGDKARTYTKFASTHLTSKEAVKYGFVETRVKLADSSAVLAVWMHDDDTTGDAFCRFRKAEGAPGVRFECPSLIRSRRWEEIDIVEQMNHNLFNLKYTPNIHVFSMSKGEFSSADGRDNGSGEMGGGPIVVFRNVFKEDQPPFNDVPPKEQVPNDYHWNPASVADLNKTWSQGWTTVGLYWSDKELRFYIDGVEVRRLANPLVHQPMYIDISHALNVNWARVEPTSAELEQYAMIDYVRVWKVSTKTGEDPPSPLELTNDIGDKFQNLYGNEIRNVFKRFPHNDDLTVKAEDVPNADSMRMSSAQNQTLFVDGNLVRQSSNCFVGPLLDNGDNDNEELSQRVIKWCKKDDGDIFKPRQSTITSDGFTRVDKDGNRRYLRSKGRMDPGNRRIHLANDARAAPVIWGKDGKVIDVERLKNGGIGAFDNHDPNSIQSGWASKGGLGKEMGPF